VVKPLEEAFRVEVAELDRRLGQELKVIKKRNRKTHSRSATETQQKDTLKDKKHVAR